MIDASLRQPPFVAALAPVMIRRRRALRIAPPPGNFAELRAAYPPSDVAAVPAGDWQADLRFFAGCYVAGLVFFLIMLS